jgi:hypothetical protein
MTLKPKFAIPVRCHRAAVAVKRHVAARLASVVANHGPTAAGQGTQDKWNVKELAWHRAEGKWNVKELAWMRVAVTWMRTEGKWNVKELAWHRAEGKWNVKELAWMRVVVRVDRKDSR